MAAGQTDRESHCELHLSVSKAAGQPVQANLLLIGSSLFLRTGDTDNNGQVIFLSLPEDDYTLVIRLAIGKELEERVSTRNGNCLQFETVRLVGSDDLSTGPEVFVGDLKAPKKAKKLYRRGSSQLQRQHWRDARRSFEEAIRAYPEFAAAYNGLGVAASEDHEFEIANSAFRNAIRLHKNYSEAYLNLAMFLIRQQELREAQLLLNDFRTFDPENRTGINLLVECLCGQQEFDAVLALVRQLHAKHYAHDPLVHRCAAEIYRQRGMMLEFERENAVISAESRMHR
jgi:tetratricopeptide (TPR) repeat protein